MDIRGWITEKILDWLTRPLPHYEHHVWNDPQALQSRIQKGDVLLVDGDNRASQIIKYLTQSSWSHAALYVGDEIVRRGGPAAEDAIALFGEDDAQHLLVEALPHGVVASPVTKYVDFNIRVARPHKLRPDHLKTILDESVLSLGLSYDLRNVLDLARYLIPVKIVPDRFRRTALHLGSSMATEVICSSLLGRTFHKVRFPILPLVEHPDGFDAPVAARPGILRRIFGYESETAYTGMFRMRHPTLLTPRDFDLSPYFEIVKFNVIGSGRFDYQRIRWAEMDEGLEATEGAAKIPAEAGEPTPRA